MLYDVIVILNILDDQDVQDDQDDLSNQADQPDHANDTDLITSSTSEATEETAEPNPIVAIESRKTVSNLDRIETMVMGRDTHTEYTCSLCPNAPPVVETIKCNPQQQNRRFSTHVYHHHPTVNLVEWKQRCH